jgi:lauroyl/myristoyl acyltransferase
VWIVAAHLREDGRYFIHARGPIHIEDTGDRLADTIAGAERLLAMAEQEILEAPRQWLMFYPVWPDASDEVP